MTTMNKPNWLITPGEPRNGPSVPAGVEYHRVLAGDKRRVGRGILAIFLLLAGFLISITLIRVATTLIDAQLSGTPPTEGRTEYTPLKHAGSMISLALLIPWSMLIQRWLYGVPGRSLHSVTSRFRFDLFGKALFVFGPIWLIVAALGALAPPETVPWSHTDLLAFFIATILLTPLQSAGEEYGVRGLVFRVVGSWTRSRRAGLIAGVVITSVLFTFVHGSTDLYINIWYLALWASLAIITWRTGGLEVAIMLHAVFNTVNLVLALYFRVDLGGLLQDRSSGVGTPYQLVPAVLVIVIAAIVWWCTRKTGPALTPSAPSATAERLVRTPRGTVRKAV